MSVISVTVVESTEQIVSGIPKAITISTNIPSSIFYTLDGSDPSLFSSIYTGTIYLPSDKLSITLKILATNGFDFSPIITEVYNTNILNNTRLPHSSTDAPPESNLPNLYPFGNQQIYPSTTFQNPGDSGLTVNNPSLPETSTGFDGSGNQTGFTNKPYNTENYEIQYSITDSIGQTGHGIGSLPAEVKIKEELPPPEYTSQYSTTFDPRALVIFQDFTQENQQDPPIINKQYFTMENPEVARDGNAFYTSGIDTPPISGSFLRSHYNPRTNMMTYYYRDSWSNRWIISTAPYQPNGTFDGNLGGMVLSKQNGAGFVFDWVVFPRRVLF